MRFMRLNTALGCAAAARALGLGSHSERTSGRLSRRRAISLVAGWRVCWPSCQWRLWPLGVTRCVCLCVVCVCGGRCIAFMIAYSHFVCACGRVRVACRVMRREDCKERGLSEEDHPHHRHAHLERALKAGSGATAASGTRPPGGRGSGAGAGCRLRQLGLVGRVFPSNLVGPACSRSARVW